VISARGVPAESLDERNDIGVKFSCTGRPG